MVEVQVYCGLPWKTVHPRNLQLAIQGTQFLNAG